MHTHAHTFKETGKKEIKQKKIDIYIEVDTGKVSKHYRAKQNEEIWNEKLKNKMAKNERVTKQNGDIKYKRKN